MTGVVDCDLSENLSAGLIALAPIITTRTGCVDTGVTTTRIYLFPFVHNI
jgi:hypothetical protein